MDSRVINGGIMESLSQIGVFVQVAEARSFVAASSVLGISASAVSKSVARLEERLGVRLFHRSTRNVTLTAEGAHYFERCRRVLVELEAASTELSQTVAKPQGRLRISLPMIAKPFLPIFGEFRRLYPAIQLDLEFTDRLVEVIPEGFDAVIRTGVPKDSGLSVKPLGSYRMVAVGSPDYFARQGTPETPEDMLDHDCIHFRFPNSGKLQGWAFVRGDQPVEVALPQSMICNTVEGRVCFALQGLGVTYLGDFVIRDELASGQLIRVLEDYIPACGQFSLLWPSGRQIAPKLRVFVDFLSERMPLARH
ncbi:MAG: Transcriptional regulator, LysR family [Pseudomonas sp.]|nr:Transcriptional regulator, LysR family [Pseudomonas sp.]